LRLAPFGKFIANTIACIGPLIDSDDPARIAACSGVGMRLAVPPCKLVVSLRFPYLQTLADSLDQLEMDRAEIFKPFRGRV
jgi:hypothetical protein